MNIYWQWLGTGERQSFLFVLSTFLLLLNNCTMSGAGEPQSWPEQQAFVQSVMHQREPDAVLYTCVTEFGHPDDPRLLPESGKALDMNCYFLNPAGAHFSIAFEEGRTRWTSRIGLQRGQRTPPPTAQELLAIEQAQSAVRIGPHDAIQVAYPLGEQFNQGPKPILNTIVGLRLGTQIEEVLGTPAAWSVLYIGEAGLGYRVWIDARDGRVLQPLESIPPSLPVENDPP